MPDILKDNLAASWNRCIVVVASGIDTKSTARKCFPDNTFIGSPIPVDVSLDPCIASRQNWIEDIFSNTIYASTLDTYTWGYKAGDGGHRGRDGGKRCFPRYRRGWCEQLLTSHGHQQGQHTLDGACWPRPHRCLCVMCEKLMNDE